MEQPQPGAVTSIVSAPEQLKILFFDVELSYALFTGFPSRKPQYLNYHQIRVQQYMHCWAAQWAGQSKIHADRQTSKESLARDDSRIIESLASLVRGADIVVAHNSDQFDVPHLRHRLIVHGQEPLGPVATIDTLKMARKLGFAHNSLSALGKELGIGAKTSNPSDLWDQAFDGNDLALQQMLRYCRNDVTMLAALFERLRPHAVSLPRMVDGAGTFCPYCGSMDYQRRKHRRTNAGTFIQYQCSGCSRYFSDKTSDAGRRQMRPL